MLTEEELEKLETKALDLIAAGDLKGGFRVYWEEMGNYNYLGRSRGRCRYAVRLLDALRNSLNNLDGAALNRNERSMIYNDLALFLTDLGDLEIAYECYSSYEELSRSHLHNHKQSLVNLSYVESLRGRLPSAVRFAREALKKPAFGPSLNVHRFASAYLANALAKSGGVEEARDHFSKSIEESPGFNYSLMGIYHAELFVREGEPEKARKLTEQNLEFCERHDSQRDVARCQLLLSSLVHSQDRERAQQLIASAQRWGVKSGDAEIAILAEMVSGSNQCNQGDLEGSAICLLEAFQRNTDNGYDLHRIDAGNALAKVDLLRGETDKAMARARAMLEDSRREECSYYFGQRDALAVLVECARGAGLLTELRKYDSMLATLVDRGTLVPEADESEEVAEARLHGEPEAGNGDQDQTAQGTDGGARASSSVGMGSGSFLGDLLQDGSGRAAGVAQKPTTPAQLRLQQIKREMGPYPDWDDSVRDQVLELLRSGADPFSRAFEAFSGAPYDLEQGVRQLMGYYGLGESNEPLPDALARTLEQVTPFLRDRDQQIVANVAAGHLPRLQQYDVLTDELIPCRLANSISIPLEDGEGYVVGTTTAFSKIIMDWSSLISSTGPPQGAQITPEALATLSLEKILKGDLEDLLSAFEKSPAEILDGLAASVELRWIQGKTPPTWEMKYLPEEIAANLEWALRNGICQTLIETFFLLHELGHVCLGHLEQEARNYAKFENGALTLENPRQLWVEELEADRYAGSVLAKVATSLTDSAPLFQPYAQYGLAQLAKFLMYTDLLDEFSGSSLRTHPPAAQRVDALLEPFESVAPRVGIDMGMVRGVVSASGGFYSGVRRRLLETRET